MIEARELGKTFPGVTPVTVFEGLSARFEPGQVTAILGPSGSGKSTLLHLLGGLDKPTAGSVWWDDVEITSLNRERLARLRAQKLGFVFQLHFLLPELTALENVLLPTVLTGRADRAAAREILGLVGLSGREHHLPSQLSGGERQRVAVARALVTRPSIVLADEPTGSLDRKNARVVFDLLVDLARQRGAGVVMATHDDGLLDGCDRVLDLVAGVLRERPQELRLV